MSNEERFFKHPETGEMLPDKRSSQKIESINERLNKIENRPIKNKAEVVDKLLLAFLGGGITIIVTNSYNIITMLLK